MRSLQGHSTRRGSISPKEWLGHFKKLFSKLGPVIWIDNEFLELDNEGVSGTFSDVNM